MTISLHYNRIVKTEPETAGAAGIIPAEVNTCILPLCVFAKGFFNAKTGGVITLMAKVEKKQVIVNEIKEKLDGAKSAVLVDARGLSVSQDTELRKKLREAGVFYKVYKNTMMSLAVKDTEFEGLEKFFEGPSALALCFDDPTTAARIISKAGKDYKALEFKAGILENVVYDAEGMKAVAEIPTKEVLLSKLLGSFKSPMASFARVINAVAEKQAEA